MISYPLYQLFFSFEKVAADLESGAKSVADPLGELIENIDIGGPSMIRAAAKNWRGVGVVISPSQYEGVLLEIRENGGLSVQTRQAM